MKGYTDLEQSKKLAEILPIETADMYYFVADSLEKQEINYAIRCGIPIVKTDIPCWNLAALLSVLPYPHLEQNYKGKWCCKTEYAGTTYLWEADNSVDACYEMILKLHEQKLL